jgi:hypothetical protein
VEAARANPQFALSVRAARPIKQIFDLIPAEFGDLIPEFNYNGQPSTVRSQISFARRRAQDRIDRLQQEVDDETNRNVLSLPVGPTRALLRKRVEEGQAKQDINIRVNFD